MRTGRCFFVGGFGSRCLLNGCESVPPRREQGMLPRLRRRNYISVPGPAIRPGRPPGSPLACRGEHAHVRPSADTPQPPRVPRPSLSALIRTRPGRHVRWRDLDLRAHQATLGAYRIHWAETGAGEETVVLLHGLSGSSRWWSRNLGALARRYRVLVPDLIGFGRSR